MFRGSCSSGVVYSNVAVIDRNDNEFSEGIDRRRLIKRSKYGEEMAKIIEKERNEQADLLKKEVMTSIDGL
jgi:hypothetical protein